MNKKPEIIRPFNRFNDDVQLVLNKEKSKSEWETVYELVLPEPGYARYCPSEYTDDTYCYFDWVDPSGGPMMTIGYAVTDNLKISNIRQLKTTPYIEPIEIIVIEK